MTQRGRSVIARELNRRSVVVTMFSISELARASRMGRRLMRIVGLEISSVIAFSSASATRARMQALRTAGVSRAWGGGSFGGPSKGRSGRKGRDMLMSSTRCHRYVRIISFRRHKPGPLD